MRMAYMVGGAVVVVGGLFCLRAPDLGGPTDPPPIADRLAAVGAGVAGLLGVRWLWRAAPREVGARRVVPWLLTIGLALVAFAWMWQRLEEAGRDHGETIEKPDGVPSEPSATLVARIRASWVPGDRVRTGLLLAGIALCASAAWRAWGAEGLPSSVLQRVGLTFAILGVACLALGVFRDLIHEPGWAHGTSVRVVPEPRVPGQPYAIGHEDWIGSDQPAGLRLQVGIGAAFVALALLLTLAARFHPDRAHALSRRTPRTPPASL